MIQVGLPSRGKTHCGIIVALFLLSGGRAAAQTVPTDLLDLSIEDLFEANVVSETEQAEESRQWHVSYTYAVSDYDEYYIGTNAVSYDDVLFEPGAEAAPNTIIRLCLMKLRRRCTRSEWLTT